MFPTLSTVGGTACQRGAGPSSPAPSLSQVSAGTCLTTQETFSEPEPWTGVAGESATLGKGTARRSTLGGHTRLGRAGYCLCLFPRQPQPEVPVPGTTLPG